MKYLAPEVWRLKEFPRPLINVYLAGDVLIDAGRRWDRKRIFAELEGREISMVALLVSFGVQSEPSIIATALIRLTTLWFAVGLGFLVLPVAMRVVRQRQ